MPSPRNRMVIQATRNGVVGAQVANPDGGPPPPSKEELMIRRILAEHRRGVSAHAIAADLAADTGYTSVAEVRAIIAEHAPASIERKPFERKHVDTAALVEMYRRGDKLADIQTALGIGRSTVNRLLRAAGVQPSRVTKRSKP